MCGIYFSVGETSINAHTNTLLFNRGPDQNCFVTYKELLFGGYVLWQQGERLTRQPIVNENLILLFNGDIFNIDKIKPETLSDVSWLAEQLSSCQNENEICAIFKMLQGPFAVIFYDKRSDLLYFARDALGRNSLLLEKHGKVLRILSTSSMSSSDVKAAELPALGLFRLNTKAMKQLEYFPWSADVSVNNVKDTFFEIFEKVEKLELFTISPNWLNDGNTFNSITADNYDFYNLSADLKCLPPNELFTTLLRNANVARSIEHFSVLLENSVKQRVRKTTKKCQDCIFHHQSVKCEHAKIAILFSGGIDCSILAVLVDKFADVDDTIDLINIAFELKNNSDGDCWQVPDRISANNSYEILQKICPKRKWNFVEVNVTREACKQQMSKHIKHLIYPLNTVLDEDLGAAFWFAAQGVGCLANKTPYKSPARVVIIGSGADELFGGYRRHRMAFAKCTGNLESKNLAVSEELKMDWLRIASRNLGRDDRIVADAKRTLRAPYIEEKLSQYVSRLKSEQRACYILDEGVGDKLFLRLYGYKLGLSSSSFLKKRAIQFGSKIANKKQNANDISAFLT